MASTMAASASSTLPPPTSPSSWSQLLPELLGRVIAHLPLPADRARFRAVCRAWHSAVQVHHVRQLPWLVLPDGSFCITTSDDDDNGDGGRCSGVFYDRLPELPPVGDDNAAMTCVIGCTDDWLALDCTCDKEHIKYVMGKICSKCSCCLLDKDDVKRKPRYLLQNAFSGATVPLTELEDVIPSVSRRFQIHKVLMRSSTPDDVIAIVTNSWDYNIILCRPGKGTHVLCYYDIFDVAFVGDRLYGITPNENLIGFRLTEDDNDGKPDVVRRRRFVTNPLPEGEEDYWSWIDDEVSDNDSDDNDDEGGGNDDDGNDNKDGHVGKDNDEDAQGDQEEEADDQSQNKEEGEEEADDKPQNKEEEADDQPQNKEEGEEEADDQPQNKEEEEEEADDQPQNKEEEDSSGGEEVNNIREDEGEADDEAQNTEEENCSSGDGRDGIEWDVVQDEESLNEPKDYIITTRKLVKSRAGDLLMVRRQMQAPSTCFGPPYTRKVEIFKADINAGKWLSVTGSCLAEDEALFLSKSFSKSVRVHGDIRARFIYFADTLLETFDTTSSTCIPSSLGEQVYRLVMCKWLTWIFPQELVV